MKNLNEVVIAQLENIKARIEEELEEEMKRNTNDNSFMNGVACGLRSAISRIETNIKFLGGK